MRKIYFTSILLGMMLAATSCEDDNKNYTDEFATVLHYKQEGIIEFDFYNVNKDMNSLLPQAEEDTIRRLNPKSYWLRLRKKK